MLFQNVFHHYVRAVAFENEKNYPSFDSGFKEQILRNVIQHITKKDCFQNKANLIKQSMKFYKTTRVRFLCGLSFRNYWEVLQYIEIITRWREHLKFIFKWKKDITSERSEQVKFFPHENINFICSNKHVIFFLLQI